jgi:hypothetical protein
MGEGLEPTSGQFNVVVIIGAVVLLFILRLVRRARAPLHSQRTSHMSIADERRGKAP